MRNIDIRMQRNIEILTMKKQEIHNAKMAVGRKKSWSDAERYKLNMEMLTWIVNTDTLLFKFTNNHWNDKEKFKKSKGSEGNEEQGILLGLYYAFNCFKHNKNILSMETVNTEESFLSFKIAKNEWVKSSELLKHKDTYEFYVEYLQGKSVGEIFEKAITYLVQQYNLAKQKEK